MVSCKYLPPLQEGWQVTCACNCRPVSLICVPCKLLEHIVWQLLAGRYSFAAHSLQMLVLLIVLYGLEGLYLHVSVCVVVAFWRTLHLSERGWGKLSSEKESNEVLEDVWIIAKLFKVDLYNLWSPLECFFYPNGQKFLRISTTSERPSEISGNCGVATMDTIQPCNITEHATAATDLYQNKHPIKILTLFSFPIIIKHWSWLKVHI